ncbi:MAG: hypothetical protein J5930_09205, partial [Treponema sp.]|nr:hypothetical protein [Treponema sp.]
SASVLLLAFKMRQWDAGKKQGGTLQGGFLDFLLTHFELFAFCFMLKPRPLMPPDFTLKEVSDNVETDLISLTVPIRNGRSFV